MDGKTAFDDMREAIKVIFAKIPKGKFGEVFIHAQALEGGVNRMAGLLSGVRRYFIETTGEESPFVKKIDELIPRLDSDPKKPV